MSQHHFFKLSAISIALFGAASQGYAVECQAPISVRDQQGVVLGNCSLERSVEKNSNIPQNTLINVDNSDLTIVNSTINSHSESYYARGMLNSQNSKVMIKEGNISHFVSSNIPSGYVLRADGSDIIVEKSSIKGNDIVMPFLHSPSKININHSTIESERLLVQDSSVWINAPFAGKTVINLNNSKVLSKHLFNNFFGNYAESIDLNTNNSDIHGEAHLWSGGMPVNMSLTDSKWTIPAREKIWRPNSISNLNLNSSDIIFAKSNREDILFSFNRLEIEGNLSGIGHFELNTNLSEQVSDKIIVKGEDSGNFTLGIQDSGNEPQAANGKVTLVETQQGQAKFSLKDRDYVDAGAYRYRLHQERTNWVLANRQAEKTTANPPVAQVQPTQPTTPATPVAPTQPTVQPTASTMPVVPTQPSVQPTVQLTQPSVPTAPALLALSEKTNALVSLRQAQSVLLSQNLQGIHQRLGEVRGDKSSNVWVKNLNSRSEIKAQNVATDSRSSGFEMDSHSLQIGADKAVSDTLRLGGFVGTSRADVDFNSEYGKGKLRSQAVGFYATFANEQGWYLDNIAKYERLTAESNSEKRKYNAFGISSEIGKRFALSNDWVVTPQAQLAYHTINGKADEERLNLLVARAGVRVAKGFALNNGWNLQPYAEVNGIAEKANSAKVQVNQYQFEVAENKGRVQGSLGLSAGKGNHRLGLEASVTSGNKLKQPFNVLVNYRYQW